MNGFRHEWRLGYDHEKSSYIAAARLTVVTIDAYSQLGGRISPYWQYRLEVTPTRRNQARTGPDHMTFGISRGSVTVGGILICQVSAFRKWPNTDKGGENCVALGRNIGYRLSLSI